jgi:3-hydroxyisobutyrate dehydrogenase-like beta-hydroxyacid dehydrogenase
MEQMGGLDLGQVTGLIGLGAIGLLLAKNLLAKGFAVHGYRRSPMTEFAGIGGQSAAFSVVAARTDYTRYR